MDFQFHCAAKARKCVRKSKHRLPDCCDDLSRAEDGALMKEAEGIFTASSGDIDWEGA